MMTVTVDGTEFAVHDTYVSEWPRRYDPVTGRGYKLDSDGQRISLLSYEEFGCDGSERELAARWCDKARRAWDEAHARDEYDG